MRAIRDAVLKKHPDFDAGTEQQPAADGFLPRLKQNRPADPLTLSPEFMFHSNDSYHVNDLLKYHDRDFIKNAYRAILKRDPDETGFLHNLKLLQSGALNKIDILASLRYSEEGKHNGVPVSGLRFPATIRTLERIPVFGYLLQLLLAFVRLPLMIRSQRQFQGYVVAQQLAIADYINERQRDSENERLDRVAVINQVQLQARELESMVNEKVLHRIQTQEERLTEAEAELLRVDERLSNFSQKLTRTHQQISGLASDVRTVERNLATQKTQTADELREWDSLYAAFEEHFRGSAEEVEERLRYYLQFLNELNADSKILDLGSGRCDWLKLLHKEGFRATGVEVNQVFAEHSRAEGFEVTHDDMMLYLGGQPDNSLDLITVFHLIEHLDTNTSMLLLDEIKRTLKPGGRVFIETPSPENLVVAACNFYADPTHHKPVNPHTLMFVLREKGFVELGLQFLHPVEGSPFKESEGSQQLNMWFYGPRDFSVIARKPR
ncbi:MAG TPA: methyltransferase domain-containing protein [Pyrinomonadaceae bacterium]